MVMKIENWNGALDTFTFPYNPTVFDVTADSDYVMSTYNYQGYGILSSSGTRFPLSLVLTGHFSGTSKTTNFDTFAQHFGESDRLKKLYFESTKFYLGVGQQLKKVHSGGRTNFIDYVFPFKGICGIAFGDTERTSGTNTGNATTYVKRIIGTVTSGASAVTLSDALGLTVTVPASVLTTNEKVLYQFVWMANTGIGVFQTMYGWVGFEVTVTNSGSATSTVAFQLVDSGGTPNFTSSVQAEDVVHNTTDETFTRVVSVTDNSTLVLQDDIMASGEAYVIYRKTELAISSGGYGVLRLKSGANVSTVATTNLTSPTVYFHDGYVV